jgi:solute:Na+ symporter, SSS family
LLTNADYFAVKYQSPLLGGLVALVGVVFLVPYITLQLTGSNPAADSRLRRN